MKLHTDIMNANITIKCLIFEHVCDSCLLSVVDCALNNGE